jgi:putative ubiquitin-RnfH superfamily antitoxin RatB of RatAB toxin-antitoxin module
MSEFAVEIVFALPGRQLLKIVTASTGDSIADVVAKSGIGDVFADQGIGDLPCGVWGQEVDRTQAAKLGDRIEIYRPLEIDPQEARRQLALSGRTMSGADSDQRSCDNS